MNQLHWVKYTVFDWTTTQQGLGQQGVWASFGHPDPGKSSPRTPTSFWEGFLEISVQACNWIFHHKIIPMTLYKDIVPYCNKLINVYGCSLSIFQSPFWNRTLKKMTIVNSGHTIYNSCQRPCHSQTHGLSQQGGWVPFWTPKPLKRTPQDTQIILCGISKNLNLKLIIELFHLLMIPMTLFNDIMPYFDEFIHVCGWNMSILWYPLKIWTPQNFTTANFRHPVSKSWLRHWSDPY